MQAANDKRERALRIIRALLDKTVERGCTPAEAAHAAAKAQELLEKYQIDAADVATGELKEDLGQHRVDTGRKVVNPGELELANKIARGLDCKMVVLQGETVSYCFVGYDSDAAVAVYTYTTLLRSLLAMAKEEGRQHGEEKAGLVRWCNNYLKGAALEIFNRMYRERQARSAAQATSAILLPSPGAASPAYPAAPVTTGTSLAVSKERPVQEYFERCFPDTKNMRRSRAEFEPTARSAGRRAGKSIALRRGLEGEDRPQIGH